MARIKFIREYDFYGLKMFDVVYSNENGKPTRCNTYTDDKLTKTAKEFIKNATKHKEQLDKTFKRTEIIHE